MELAPRERMEIYVKLSGLLNSGISLNESLELLFDQQRKASSKKVLGAVKNYVSKGASLSQALNKAITNTKQFEIPLITAGEKSGHLVEVLAEVGKAIERDIGIWSKLVSKSKGSFFLIHFAAVLFPGVALLQENIGIVDFIIKTASVLLVFYAFIYFIWYSVRPSSLGQSETKFSGFLFHLPILGSLLKRIDCYRFLFCYWLLNKAGVEKNQTLKIANNAVSFNQSQRATQEVSSLLLSASPLYKGKYGRRFFPENLLESWHTSIVSGEEDKTLEHQLSLLEAEIEKKTDLLVYVVNKIIYFYVLFSVAYGIYKFYAGRLEVFNEIEQAEGLE